MPVSRTNSHQFHLEPTYESHFVLSVVQSSIDLLVHSGACMSDLLTGT